MLCQFHALPTEARVQGMKERDFLWCLVNQLLDEEEELERMCPACRTQAQENRCPVCGGLVWETEGEVNPAFDMERFLAMKGESRG